MIKKLKGKCRKCVGCNKIFEKGFYGTKKCKYYTRKIEEGELNFPFLGLVVFEIFIIIAFMFFLYRILMLSVGG